MPKLARLTPGEVIEEFLSTYRVPLILCSVSLLSAVTGIAVLLHTVNSSPPITFTEATGSADMAPESLLVVDVAGAVNRPGVYKIAAGSRIQDAIDEAGGLSGDADTELLARSVNRAQKCADGGKIYIPRKSENRETLSNQIQTVSVFGESSSGNTVISVNAASQSELETLNGIGPKTAEKIIANRPYLSLPELVEKRVLTQNLFDKLKGQLGL